MREMGPERVAKVLEAGDRAVAVSTHTFVLTTQPKASTPSKGSATNAVRATPIRNANPSSVRSHALMTPSKIMCLNKT